MIPLATPAPVIAADLFAPDRAAFVELLRSLGPADWSRPTVCPGWDVKDVVAHVVGGDLTNLSRRRDGQPPLGPAPGQPLLEWLNQLNQRWVAAARIISPASLVDLLAFLGPQVATYFASLDAHAIGGPVSWAGPDPAPVWLDIAREYTERWLHQQHVRDALGRPGQRGPRFLAPVLSAFVHALPYAYRATDAPEGTTVVVELHGPSGGRWSVVRQAGHWHLYEGAANTRIATATMSEDTAWRLLTRGLDAEAARAAVRLDGDRQLAAVVLDAVAIIA